MVTLEKRFCEVRQAGRRLSGTAIRYGDIAQMPFGREKFEAGAFSPIGDVLLNAHHARSAPLARTDGGGLVLTDSAEALRIVADLPATREADDVLELVRKKVLRGLSIEFRAAEERLEGDLRIISRAALAAVSVVDTGAYPDATVEARRRGGGRSGGRGRVRYNRKLACRCVGEGCRVKFKKIAADDGDDIIATTGGMDQAFASTKARTLRLRQVDDGLDIELDAAALTDTEAGRQLVEQSAAGVAIYARPIVDYDRTPYRTDAAGVRLVDEARIVAVLFKPIAGPDEAREGWEAVKFTVTRPPRRRARVWL